VRITFARSLIALVFEISRGTFSMNFTKFWAIRSRVFRSLFLVMLAISCGYAKSEPLPPTSWISQVIVSGRTAIIEVEPKVQDGTACALSGNGRYLVDIERDRNLFTLALSAATAKLIVGFRTEGCAKGYPLITEMAVIY
jgi:hypothetical protein